VAQAIRRAVPSSPPSAPTNLPLTFHRSTPPLCTPQGLKSTAVLCRFNASYTYDGRTPRELALRRMARLDREVGLPTGMYNGELAGPPLMSGRPTDTCNAVSQLCC
jgi:hypothetical protein